MSVGLFGNELATNLGTLANAFFADQNQNELFFDLMGFGRQNNGFDQFTGRQSQLEADIIGIVGQLLAGFGPAFLGPIVGVVAVIAGTAALIYSNTLTQQIADRNAANNNNNNDDNTAAIIAATVNPGVSAILKTIHELASLQYCVGASFVKGCVISEFAR